nr:uncharacterized protein LOC122273167 [Parasteatoda tepidariorum]
MDERYLSMPLLTYPLRSTYDNDYMDIESEAEPEIILTIDGEALDETVDQESQNGVTVTPSPPTPVAGTEETPAKATYSMFRKRTKKSAPSAAQKAASSIEEKYRLEIQVLKSKEERDVEEHMLKMRLLSAQIKFQENLNRILRTNPTSLNISLNKCFIVLCINIIQNMLYNC